MNIPTAVAWVETFGRNMTGDSSFYTQVAKQMAIQAIGNDFIRRTRCTRKISGLALTSGSAVLPALPTGFLPERLLLAYLTGANVIVDPRAAALEGCPGRGSALDKIDFVELQNLQLSQQDPPAGQPRKLAFDSWTSGQVWPTPTDNFNLNFRWLEPFTTWTPGQAFVTATVAAGIITGLVFSDRGTIYPTAPTITVSDPTGAGLTMGTVTVANGAITAAPVTVGGTLYSNPTVYVNGVAATPLTLNLPDDWLQKILMDGAPSMIQLTEPEQFKIAAAKWASYLDFCRTLPDAGSLGAASVASGARAW